MRIYDGNCRLLHIPSSGDAYEVVWVRLINEGDVAILITPDEVLTFKEVGTFIHCGENKAAVTLPETKTHYENVAGLPIIVRDGVVSRVVVGNDMLQHGETCVIPTYNAPLYSLKGTKITVYDGKPHLIEVQVPQI